jgi:hypothetical protein
MSYFTLKKLSKCILDNFYKHQDCYNLAVYILSNSAYTYKPFLKLYFTDYCAVNSSNSEKKHAKSSMLFIVLAQNDTCRSKLLMQSIIQPRSMVRLLSIKPSSLYNMSALYMRLLPITLWSQARTMGYLNPNPVMSNNWLPKPKPSKVEQWVVSTETP